MVALEVQSTFGINWLVWISSLVEDEMGPTNRIIEDVEPYIVGKELIWDFKQVKSIEELYKLLDQIAVLCSSHHGRPIIHFDMHGLDKGLKIAHTGQTAPWSEVVPRLRAINVVTGNNLCVIAGVCHAFFAITEVNLSKPCPAYLLIAPQEKVTFGFLEKNIPEFYREVFSTGNISDAYEKHLAPDFRAFHSGRFLTITITRYIERSCKGKSLSERRERLLSEVMLNGMKPTPENLKAVRKRLKAGLRPDQDMLNRYAATFLINKPCPFTMDQLLNLVFDKNKHQGL